MNSPLSTVIFGERQNNSPVEYPLRKECNAYLAVLKCRTSALFQYRMAALASIGSQLVWGIIRIMVFTAFYEHATATPPISLAESMTFIWLGQAFVQMLPWTLDKDIESQIKTGNVAYELLRPLDLYWLWYTRAFALRVVPTLMRALLVFAIAIPFLGLSSPVSWEAGLIFSLSITLGAFIAAAITTFVLISLFWTVSGEGIQRLMPSIALLLTGLIVPLPLFPDWAQPFLNIQPFRGILDIPSRIYMGVIPVNETLSYLGFQVLWIVLLVSAGKFLVNRALKQLTIAGG